MNERPARDRYLTCALCGNRFLLTAMEQRQRLAMGQRTAPRECPACRALERLSQHQHGTLDWYNPRRGYGFIKQDDGTSVFLHASEWRAAGHRKPTPGLRVRYRVQAGERGPRAVEVELLPESEST